MLVVEFPSKPISRWLRKITLNDDASTHLDEAVLEMTHRYQLLVKEPDAGCRIPFKTHQPLVTQNYSKRRRLNSSRRRRTRYATSLPTAGKPAGIHPSQRFKTSSCTYPNDVVAPITTSSCAKETPAAGFYMQKQYSPLVTRSWILSIVRANHQPPAATRIKPNDWNSKVNQSQATVTCC
ncbi:hypothetical protein F511_44021 [Dorcoceras hygrometricum]|uniref:Uncharacterized protein n=1 Tax=Dorcoceras hygrometricum TaxID=472368 RepID=A0A2Z7CYD8_9LAMI|nr:hypothetical protein F511_44021 [Dorcoceras hygrometricum]